VGFIEFAVLKAGIVEVFGGIKTSSSLRNDKKRMKKVLPFVYMERLKSNRNEN